MPRLVTSASLHESESSPTSRIFGRARRLFRKTTEYAQADARPASSELSELVLLQEADGSWPLTDALAAVLGADVYELRAAMGGAHGDEDVVLRAWATALALAWLERHAAESRDEWSLLAKKAQAWLDAASVTPAPGITWREAALEQLAP